MLIYVQHYAAFQQGRVPEPMPTYVAGFRQWLGLNRHVMKGQSGYAVLAPVTARFASSTPENTDSWRRLGRGEKPGFGEAVRSRLVGLKPAHVWDPLSRESAPRVTADQMLQAPLSVRVCRALVPLGIPPRGTDAGTVLVRMAGQMALLETEALAELTGDAGGGRRRACRSRSTPTRSPSGSCQRRPPRRSSTRPPSMFTRRTRITRSGCCGDGTVMAAVTTEARAVQGCRAQPLGTMRYVAVVSPELSTAGTPCGSASPGP